VNPAYLLAGLGSVLYGGADFCGGFAARRSSALAVTFLSGFAGLAVLFLGLPFAPGVTRASDMIWGAAGGLFGGVGAMLVYRALAIGPVSVASPIFSITGLGLPVIVGLALGERPSWVALSGLALSPVAIVLLGRGTPTGPGAAHDPRRAVVPSLTAGAVLGFFLVFLGRIERGADLWPLVIARSSGLAVLLGALLWRRQPLMPSDTARGWALATGGLDSLANLAYVTAVQRGSLSLVAALVSLAPATTVLLGRAVFAERWSGPQRAGLLLALAAGVCISLG
jgi:drug/metabolite transporter (DMT)-like permease